MYNQDRLVEVMVLEMWKSVSTVLASGKGCLLHGNIVEALHGETEQVYQRTSFFPQ